MLLSLGSVTWCLNKGMHISWIIHSCSWVLCSSSKEFEKLLSSLSELHAVCSFCLMPTGGGFYRVVHLFFFVVLQDTKNNIKFKIKFYMDFFFFPLGLIITLDFLIFEFFSVSFGYKATIVLCDDGRIWCKHRRQPVFQVEAMFFWRRVRLKNSW